MATEVSCVPVPVEFDGLDAAIAAVLRASEGAEAWDARTRRAVMTRVQRQLSRLTAVNLTVVAAEQRAGTWRLSGDRDLPGLLGRLSREGRGAGFQMAGQAATLAAMPAVADALVDGPVTPRHLQEIARATGSSPKLAAALATSEGQEQVVQLAGRLDATEFGKALAHQAATLDPASRQRTHDEQRSHRYLNLSHTPGGTLVKGQLDSVAGTCLQRAIDALCPLPAESDDRDRGQRQADALTAMATAVLSDPTTTPGSVIPAQVTLVVSEQTWVALRTPAQAEPDGTRDDQTTGRLGRGSTRDVVARLRSVAPVTDDDGAVLPATEIAKALCDCQITRIVLGADGVPLNEGRAKRLFTPHQRKAVIARDGGGCAFPGCTMPARYTQLHHLTWWSRGGPTDLDQAIQLCHHHHGDVHDHDIHITRNHDGSHTFTHPDGQLAPGSPPPDTEAHPHHRPMAQSRPRTGATAFTPDVAHPCPPVAVAPGSRGAPELGTGPTTRHRTYPQAPAGAEACPTGEQQLLWTA